MLPYSNPERRYRTVVFGRPSVHSLREREGENDLMNTSGARSIIAPFRPPRPETGE